MQSLIPCLQISRVPDPEQDVFFPRNLLCASAQYHFYRCRAMPLYNHSRSQSYFTRANTRYARVFIARAVSHPINADAPSGRVCENCMAAIIRRIIPFPRASRQSRECKLRVYTSRETSGAMNYSRPSPVFTSRLALDPRALCQIFSRGIFFLPPATYRTAHQVPSCDARVRAAFTFA